MMSLSTKKECIYQQKWSAATWEFMLSERNLSERPHIAEVTLCELLIKCKLAETEVD